MLSLIHYPTTELVCICLRPIYILPPLRMFRVPSRCLHPLHIHPVMFPQPLGHPWTQSHLCHQKQVHNGPDINKLCDHVQATGNIGLHLLKSRLLHHVLKRGYTYTPYLPWIFSLPVRFWATLWCNLPNNLLIRGVHHPRLIPIQYDWLDHHQLYLSQGPGIRTLPDKQPYQPHPIMPWFPKVDYHRWPVVFLRQYNSP